MTAYCTRWAGFVCLLFFGLWALPAAAEEDLATATAMTSVTLADAPDGDAPSPRVSLAVPVGNVVLGANDQAHSSQRYAARMAVAGSGMVRFSTLRPSLISRVAVGASLPAGLPLASARLTSNFGVRRNPVTGIWRNHGGIDLAAPTGAPVAATGGGTIRFAGPAGNYGLLVVVDHGSGLESRYAHLSRIAVRSGQAVAAGDLLGLVGSTGRSTGPHLHYELRANGHALDPLRR